MDKLRVDTGIKVIEVNDAGECIQFSVTDSNFFKGFFEFIDWLESDELKKSIDEMEKQKEAINDEKDISAVKKVNESKGNIIKQAMDKIDAIFGEDASRKVFCGIVPDIYAIIDFVDKIMPFVDKYANERQRYISKKYSTKRKGAKS